MYPVFDNAVGEGELYAAGNQGDRASNRPRCSSSTVFGDYTLWHPQRATWWSAPSDRRYYLYAVRGIDHLHGRLSLSRKYSLRRNTRRIKLLIANKYQIL